MKNIDEKEKATLYSHLYSFASVKQVVHWFQIIRHQRFQMYDESGKFSHLPDDTINFDVW